MFLVYEMLRKRAGGDALINVKASAFIPVQIISLQLVLESYKFKGQ